MMGGAARFHHHMGRRRGRSECGELAAVESMPRHDVPLPISDRDLDTIVAKVCLKPLAEW
jgi:hypothetical protein